MRVFSLKVADDDPVAVYLSQTGNVSATLRAIVEQYITKGGNPPPPTAPANPVPGGGAAIDYEEMGRVMYRVMTRVFDEHQTTIPQGAPLNNAPTNGKRPQQVIHMETSTMVEREDDDGGAVPLDYVSDSPDEILRSMGMA